MDENTRLRNSGLSDAAIARMSQNERYEALVRLENAPSPDATAGAAAGATGLALVGALVLGRRREGEATDNSEPPKMPEVPMPVPTPLANPGDDIKGNTPPKAPESPAEPKKLVERYPLDSADLARPVSIDRIQYTLTEQGRSEVRNLQDQASKISKEPITKDMVELKQSQENRRAETEKPLKDLRQEILSLREKIESSKMITSSMEDTILNSTIFGADQARLTKLLNQEANLAVKVNKELATLSATEANELKTLTGQAKLKNLDSIVNNPYRSEVTKIEKQLASMDTKSADYKQLKGQYDSLKIKSNAFDSSRDLLFNPKTKPADLGLAAERIRSLNVNAEVPAPISITVPENRPNSESLAPGYDPKGKVGGVLPGINYPGAEVSNTPLDHSSRGKGTAYHATDIALPHGTPYMPVAEGTAVVGENLTLGKFVKLKHNYGVETLYGHNSQFQVTNDQYVSSTTVIANVGNTGNVGSSYPKEAPWYGGSHIHYELHINEAKIPSENFDWGRYNTEGQSYVDQYYEQYGPKSPGYHYEIKK